MTTGEPVRVGSLLDGAVVHLVLATPKANVIDAATVAALDRAFRGPARASAVKAVLLEGEGPNFSFGASVAEHLPDRVGEMLASFHALFLTMAEASVPIVAVVRGQCLGGGLELAAFAHRVVASPDARLGQPEIRLGVLAPIASVILPERIGRPAAEDLCLTGRVISAEDALDLALVDQVADDPTAAAVLWIREHLVPLSAAALRRAVRAVRWSLDRRLREDLPAIERLYLEDLMATNDAKEGIQAFLDKRPPVWTNR